MRILFDSAARTARPFRPSLSHFAVVSGHVSLTPPGRLRLGPLRWSCIRVICFHTLHLVSSTGHLTPRQMFVDGPTRIVEGSDTGRLDTVIPSSAPST
jgi:hypothetical protein